MTTITNETGRVAPYSETATYHFPVSHGISMEEGSYIQNLVTEDLPSTFEAFIPGRIWYSSEAKALKYSTLDENGAVVTETVNSLSAFSEITTLIETNLQDEIDRAKAAEQANATAISQEVTNRINAISQEVSDREAAILVETNARTSADDAIKARLNVVEGGGEGSIAKAYADAVSYTNTKVGEEEAARLATDSDLETRLQSIEAGMVSGVVPMASLDDVSDLGSLDESNLQHGWAYYIKTQNDVYMYVTKEDVTESDVDYLPSGFDKGGFIKYADFSELSGLISTEEQARIDAIAAAKLAANDYTDVQTGLVTADLNTYKTSNDSALAQEVSDREAGDTQLRTDFEAADSALDLRVQELENNVDGDMGDLSALTTTHKETLVGSINEVNAEADANAENIAQEVADRINAISTLTSTVNANKQSADNNHLVQKSRLDVIEGADTVDGSFAKAIKEAVEAEAVLRAAGDTNEAAARIAGDDALDGRLSTVEGQVNGKIGDLDTLATEAKDNVVNSINEVEGELVAEVSRAKAAEQANASALEAYKTSNDARNVTNESSIAQNASDLSAEVTARTNADTALQDNIDAEVTARTNADTALQDNIDAEETARLTEVQGVRDAITNSYFKYTDPTAKTEHTISHNLGSMDILWNVLTDRGDGIFRNDIVAVDVVDANTIVVRCTTARKIRASVKKMFEFGV